jgi:hypothetical protein
MRTVIGCLLFMSLTTAGPPAMAQEVVGRRLFSDQLVLSEPFVEDELSFPSVLHVRTPLLTERRHALATAIGAEIKKRITSNFETSINGGLTVFDQDDAASLAGFNNLELGFKYQFLRDPVHELVASAALMWESGGTGRTATGAESFDTLHPALLFGKGLGDLPDSLAVLRPFAIGGLLGAGIPTRRASKVVSVEAGETTVGLQRHNPIVEWGAVLEYSFLYLDSMTKDLRVPIPLSQMIPIAELDLQTPVEGQAHGRTTGTANLGAVWVGKAIQVGLEAVVPINERSGKNLGVRAFVRFDLGGLFGEWAGRPLFGRH